MNDSVEAIVVVSGVVNSPDGTVRFNKAVLSLDNIAIPGFVLGFDVSGVVVIHSVFEGIMRGCLKSFH